MCGFSKTSKGRKYIYKRTKRTCGSWDVYILCVLFFRIYTDAGWEEGNRELIAGFKSKDNKGGARERLINDWRRSSRPRDLSFIVFVTIHYSSPLVFPIETVDIRFIGGISWVYRSPINLCRHTTASYLFRTNSKLSCVIKSTDEYLRQFIFVTRQRTMIVIVTFLDRRPATLHYVADDCAVFRLQTVLQK